MIFPEYTLADLTHPITAGMPVWPGDPAVVIEPLARHARDGYNLNRLCMGEHSGTHAGAPRHFLEAGAASTAIPPEQLVLPGIKISHTAARDSLLGLAEIRDWEARKGRVPAGHAVLIETRWDRFWDDAAAYLGRDEAGHLHFPGLSVPAARYLICEREVRVIGIDSAGVDGGRAADYPVDILLAQHGGIHVENLRGLAALPESGFFLFIGLLPIEAGTGSPARVLALMPPI